MNLKNMFLNVCVFVLEAGGRPNLTIGPRRHKIGLQELIILCLHLPFLSRVDIKFQNFDPDLPQNNNNKTKCGIDSAREAASIPHTKKESSFEARQKKVILKTRSRAFWV